jgi:hypothetical protein
VHIRRMGTERSPAVSSLGLPAKLLAKALRGALVGRCGETDRASHTHSCSKWGRPIDAARKPEREWGTGGATPHTHRDTEQIAKSTAYPEQTVQSRAEPSCSAQLYSARAPLVSAPPCSTAERRAKHEQNIMQSRA